MELKITKIVAKSTKKVANLTIKVAQKGIKVPIKCFSVSQLFTNEQLKP